MFALFTTPLWGIGFGIAAAVALAPLGLGAALLTGIGTFFAVNLCVGAVGAVLGFGSTAILGAGGAVVGEGAGAMAGVAVSTVLTLVAMGFTGNAVKDAIVPVAERAFAPNEAAAPEAPVARQRLQQPGASTTTAAPEQAPVTQPAAVQRSSSRAALTLG